MGGTKRWKGTGPVDLWGSRVGPTLRAPFRKKTEMPPRESPAMKKVWDPRLDRIEEPNAALGDPGHGRSPLVGLLWFPMSQKNQGFNSPVPTNPDYKLVVV